MANKKKTGKNGKNTLGGRSPRSNSKTTAGSALSQTGTPKQTSPRVATIAAKTLSPKSPKKPPKKKR